MENAPTVGLERPDQERAASRRETSGNSIEIAESLFFLDESGKPIKASLPEWLDHFNARDLKTVFKCSLAVWIATLFILIDPLLDNYGPSVFFASIVLLIVPCNGIVFVHFLAALTMVFGMLLGWAWGVITMAAALATRPVSETNARLAELAKETSKYVQDTKQPTTQAEYMQRLISNGFMLDARVTITYFCMLGVFVYLVARIRVAAPKLALLQIFAIVVADVFFTTGPLLPSFSGTIPAVLIKPALTAVAIGIACNVLVFPESTSYVALKAMEDTVTPIKGFLRACQLHLKQDSARFDGEHLKKTRARMIEAYKGLEASLGFLPLDLSTGRWDADDIRTLKNPTRQLLIASLSLLQLHITQIESKAKLERLDEVGLAMEGEDTSCEIPETGRLHLVQILNLRRQLQHPDDEKLCKSSSEGFSASERLLESCAQAVDAIKDAIHNVNQRRWFRVPSIEECNSLRESHEKVLQKLVNHRNLLVRLTSQHLADCHDSPPDGGGLCNPHWSPSIASSDFVSRVIFEERILRVSSATSALLSRIVVLERERLRTKIWFPKGLRQGIGRIAETSAPQTAGPPGTSAAHGGVSTSAKSPDTNQTRKKKQSKSKRPDESSAKHQLNVLHFHGGKKRSPVSKIILSITSWLGNTEGMYALRVLIVSIALAVPAVIHSSAGFYYREEGIWALIMAQSGLVTYTADFVQGFILRFFGTVVGGVLGMLCWYVGAGNGPGNPYGLAAVMALAITLLIWGRLFASPASFQCILLMAATIYLVVSYSWEDTHLASYGNPGAGYTIFWRRTLLVLVGFTASAIVTYFPRPPSASRHCRCVLSSSIQNSKDVYALYAMSLSKSYPDLKETSEELIIANAEKLVALATPVELLKFELSSTGFDSNTLTHVLSLCGTLNQSLGQMFVYSSMLPPNFQKRFSELSGTANSGIVESLFAVLTLIEQVLKTGDALPTILPVPLLTKCKGLRQAFAEEETSEGYLRPETVCDDGFRKYCMAISAFVQFLSATDELVWRVKHAVGETQVVDVESLF